MLKRAEVAFGVVALLATAAFALPRLDRVRLRSHRAEVPMMLDEMLREAMNFHNANERWPTLEATPVSSRVLSPLFHRWPSARLGDFWQPSLSEVRGSYQLVVEGDSVRGIGKCDVDGDGELAVYEARPGQPARALTPPDVY